MRPGRPSRNPIVDHTAPSADLPEPAFPASPQADWRQLRLVFEALHERATMLALAPHLAAPLPILTVSGRNFRVPRVFVCAGPCLCCAYCWCSN